MTASKTILRSLALGAGLGLALGVLAACEPELGSPEWCEEMKDKPTGDWTVNEAGAFTKHCLLGQPPEEN
ncbi:MAG: DUF3012 domain-containing protein [Rhodovibrionaceae bacterium]